MTGTFLSTLSKLCLIFAFISLVFSPAMAASQEVQATENQRRQPNIVFLMADDLGIGELGCYGSEVLATPNIDLICREGIKFNRAYSGATVCAPSRCILMTGQHAGQCSIRSNSGGVPLPDRDVTIAEVLKSLGYATGGFGKWALGTAGSEGDPQRQGFDQFYGYYHQTHAHSHYAEFLVVNGEAVPIDGNIGANFDYEKNGFVSNLNPSTGKTLTYAPYLLLERAEAFIRANADKPFLCYLPLTLPHGHFLIPETDEATQNLQDKPWSDRAKAVGAMTQLLDRQVGHLMAVLKELNLDDDTILIFCSDHGAALRFDGELDASGPFRGFKRSMYEGGLRIPLIVRWPGKIAPGRESDHVAYLGDVFATLVDLACQNHSQRQQIESMLIAQQQSSVSFAPTLLDQTGQQQHEFLIWEYANYNPAFDVWDGRMQALRAGNWKLLRNRDDQPWELYDLEHDPYEEHDLATGDSERVQRMKTMFLENWTSTPRQYEAMLDWMTPFTWENRERFQRKPPSTVEQIVADSAAGLKNVEFVNDAVLLGARHERDARGLIHLNIAWQLKAGRRPLRSIYVCDKNGQIVRQIAANKDLFERSTGAETIVDYIVLTPDQTKSGACIAVGFYDPVGKTVGRYVDQSTGRMQFRLTLLQID